MPAINANETHGGVLKNLIAMKTRMSWKTRYWRSDFHNLAAFRPEYETGSYFVMFSWSATVSAWRVLLLLANTNIAVCCCCKTARQQCGYESVVVERRCSSIIFVVYTNLQVWFIVPVVVSVHAEKPCQFQEEWCLEILSGTLFQFCGDWWTCCCKVVHRPLRKKSLCPGSNCSGKIQDRKRNLQVNLHMNSTSRTDVSKTVM